MVGAGAQVHMTKASERTNLSMHYKIKMWNVLLFLSFICLHCTHAPYAFNFLADISLVFDCKNRTTLMLFFLPPLETEVMPKWLNSEIESHNKTLSLVSKQDSLCTLFPVQMFIMNPFYRNSHAKVFHDVNKVFPATLFIGLYMEPTVFTDVTDDMMMAKEESFGPIMIITRFSSR